MRLRLLGEYDHQELVRCVQHEDCRLIAESIFGAYQTNSIALGAAAAATGAGIPLAAIPIVTGQVWLAYERRYG